MESSPLDHQGSPWNTVLTMPLKHLQIRSLGREDPLEKEMATHSSILAWKIPWMEEPGGGHKESHRLSMHTHTYALAIISLSMNDWVPTQGLKTLHENILLYKEKAS